MRFEWDPEKARSNLAKHKVSFEFASTAFEDDNAVSIPDRFVDGEQRWRTVARAAGGITILFVAHTYTDDDGEIFVRLIMARRASSQEKKAYERGDEGFSR